MSKLLRANMRRLWRNKIFWLFFWAVTAWGVVERIGASQDKEMHYLEEAFWIQALLIGIVLAVFVSLFVGVEYEGGTIRNKIAAGHSRVDVYLANVFVCMLAGWMMCLGCLISSLTVGVPLMGFFHMDPAAVFREGICVFALSAAYAAIYCLPAMLIHNRAVTAVTCVLLSFLLLFAGMAVAERLEESEYYYMPDPSLGIGEVDNGENSEWFRNPDYLEGAERRVYETIFVMIPGGQSLQLSGMRNLNPRHSEMFLFSCAWIMVSCGCGVMAFRKKDLK